MAEAILYKLTDAQGQTRGGGTNHTQWGAGVTHEAAGPTDGPLCSASWIHAYEHPLVAVLLNPIHADLKNPQLWSCRGEIGKRDGPLKCGCRKLTTVEILPLPEITTEQKVRFAIGCAWPRTSESWKKWATGWLSRKDRTAAAAEAAEAAAAEAAAAAFDAAAGLVATWREEAGRVGGTTYGMVSLDHADQLEAALALAEAGEECGVTQSRARGFLMIAEPAADRTAACRTKACRRRIATAAAGTPNQG